MSKLYVDNIQPKTTGGVINAKNMVIQVIVGGITSRFGGAESAGNYEDVPSLNATITPTSTNSKILVTLSGGIGNTAGGNATLLRLYRDSTNIGNGTGGSGSPNDATPGVNYTGGGGGGTGPAGTPGRNGGVGIVLLRMTN